MTKKQELYNKIREIRNKHFKPVLEFGCELIGGDTYIGENSDSNGEQSYYFVKSKKPANKYLSKTFSVPANYEKFENEILGKPVSLNDVLRMVEKMQISIIMSENGFVMSNDSPNNHKFLFKLDLTLPISEQSTETLEALLKLI